jgi:hypothetical protein
MNDDRETTDRELIENAANAAGLRVQHFHEDAGLYIVDPIEGGSYWNPLRDDGEALRLAAQLRISVGYDGHAVGEWVFAQEPEKPDTVSVRQYVRVSGGDFAAAYRRAIVLAAAEMATERRD